jgi:hypothetical protein
MKTIPQFDASEISPILMQYFLDYSTLQQVTKELNALLRAKAQAANEREERIANRPSRRPTNRF